MPPYVRAAINDGILFWHIEDPATWVDGKSMGSAAFRRGTTAHAAKWRNRTQFLMLLPLIPHLSWRSRHPPKPAP